MSEDKRKRPHELGDVSSKLPPSKRAKINELVTNPSITHSTIDPESILSTDELAMQEGVHQSRFIHVTSTPEELDAKISSFIASKRHDVDLWNQREFVDPEAHRIQPAARTSTTSVDKSRQIKVYTVENPDGPLINQHNLPEPERQPTHAPLYTFPPLTPAKQNDGDWQTDVPIGVEERLRNLEEYLFPGRSVKAVPRDVYARIKRLEERVLALERKGLLPTTKELAAQQQAMAMHTPKPTSYPAAHPVEYASADANSSSADVFYQNEDHPVGSSE